MLTAFLPGLVLTLAGFEFGHCARLNRHHEIVNMRVGSAINEGIKYSAMKAVRIIWSCQGSQRELHYHLFHMLLIEYV